MFSDRTNNIQSYGNINQNYMNSHETNIKTNYQNRIKNNYQNIKQNN